MVLLLVPKGSSFDFLRSQAIKNLVPHIGQKWEALCSSLICFSQQGEQRSGYCFASVQQNSPVADFAQRNLAKSWRLPWNTEGTRLQKRRRSPETGCGFQGAQVDSRLGRLTPTPDWWASTRTTVQVWKGKRPAPVEACCFIPAWMALPFLFGLLFAFFSIFWWICEITAGNQFHTVLRLVHSHCERNNKLYP